MLHVTLGCCGCRRYRVAELFGNYVLPAPQRVSDLACAYFRSQVLFAINELGVPEALEQGPCSGAQLAAVCGCHQPYLERVLRLAARLQLVGVSEPPGATAGDPGARMYSLTQLSAVLCSSHPNSVKAMVSLFADHYAPFERLADGVRSAAGAGGAPAGAGGGGRWCGRAR